VEVAKEVSEWELEEFMGKEEYDVFGVFRSFWILSLPTVYIFVTFVNP
jgi:hypothetical protein